MSFKKLHAEHNEAICNHLNLQDRLDCNDWIVTTSFYTAIHYIDHKLFPVVENGVKFEDINQAHRIINSSSLHQTRGILVQRHMTELAPSYTFLKEECHNARYVNYDINCFVSDRAHRLMNEIKKHCL